MLGNESMGVLVSYGAVVSQEQVANSEALGGSSEGYVRHWKYSKGIFYALSSPVSWMYHVYVVQEAGRLWRYNSS